MSRFAPLACLLIASLAIPAVAQADDCSSLGDCFVTAQEMYGSLAFLTLGLALLFAWIATGPVRASRRLGTGARDPMVSLLGA